jgi:4-amino-4-deoxy-L-arabinose transferase-like glycosyltransferase
MIMIKNNRKFDRLVKAFLVIIFLFLAFYNLTRFPVTWFDEGSHLHVPKTLVRFGVYADYSSEGFRYYGPTVGLGPTVMLPIAGVFSLFGIGLLQARIVMAVYLCATVYVFYRLAESLGGEKTAWVAVLLLVSSRSISLLTYGRQVLGEVAGFFFLAAGLWLWLDKWEKSKTRNLVIIGLLFGLSIVTKYQYLIVVAATIGLAWIFNLLYYKKTTHKTFLIPGIIAGICFVIWQTYQIVYLGPSTTAENLAQFRQFTAGAALVFSPSLILRGIQQLLDFNVFSGAILLFGLYGFFISLPRTRDGQRWGTLFILAFVNLGWFVVASISWLRYAFPGLAIMTLFVARFFSDLTNHFTFDGKDIKHLFKEGSQGVLQAASRLALLMWLAAMVLVPMAQTAVEIVRPPENTPVKIAEYLEENVPLGELIETWEPELGFLTNHNYHYPPQILLNTAVQYIWTGGQPPAEQYDFVQNESPKYVLIGQFSRWVNMYPEDLINENYQLETTIGAYELYKLR